jgi:ATP-dependent Clp protease adaptor protein ClpS
MATTLPLVSSAMTAAPTIAPSRSSQTTRQHYPNFKIIVLNDDFNTFQHVSESLLEHIPGMTADRAWELTNQIHFEGQAIVWVGPAGAGRALPYAAWHGRIDDGSPRSGVRNESQRL